MINNIVRLNIIFLAINFSFISGCSNRIHEQSTDKYDFNLKMKSILGNDISIVNSLNKADVQLAYIELPKNSIKINQVIEFLKKDGWILKGRGIGANTYCLGSNNSINIVRPISFNTEDFKRNKLKVTNINVDIISYSYNKWGDDLCE